MSGAASTLSIPVESQVRELDGKLLLSCVAAERGFPVVLGSRAFVHYMMPFLPRGVYLAKSMRSLSERMFGIVRGLGHEIVAWDEESLVRGPTSVYYGDRLSPETLRAVSVLFAWGQDDAEVFRGFPASTRLPIHVTGNPRIDLLRKDVRGYFQPEVDAIRRRFADFILVNTSFRFVNAFVPSLNLLQPGPAGGAPRISANARRMSDEFAIGMAAHQQAIFDAFRALVPVLSERFSDHAIVVRPHPAERDEPWERVARGRPNVRVVKEGNAIPWLIACRVLIHNGCTTAVEGAVLDTPAVTYQPVQSDRFDFPLPNALSHRAFRPDEVTRIVGSILAGRLGPLDGGERARIFDRHLTALEGPLAADRIVDVLEARGYAGQRPPRPTLGKYVPAWIGGNVRTTGKLISMRRRHHRSSAAFHAHRFPELTVSDLESRIERFRRVLGRFEGVRVTRLAPYVFRIAGAG
ncbi:MAG TPA: surface carbohydrate biosynthesis protein [Methylomirabilota bacterium]|nr:surface carbohydrate biosynthesis protein [Methylomirabilota bacterium]